MRRLPPLSALRAFEAAARHGSFKLAAGELAVTPTAISHQIRVLEEYTGLALFDRQVRKVVLTASGAALYPVLRDGFNSFETALQALHAPEARPQVTISATNAFMARWLAPRVAGFHTLHPGIDLELHASDHPVALDAGPVDLAIRYGRGPYAGAVSEALFDDVFAPMAAPGLVDTLPGFDALPLIDFRWTRQHPRNPTWAHWFAAAGMQWTGRPGLRFSDEGHAIQAALSGQGVALLSIALLAEDLRAGRLVRLPGPALPGHTYHLVRSAGHLLSRHVDAAQAWLRAEALAARG
jgi:LysR family glycine cleavage system transcriptional activator